MKRFLIITFFLLTSYSFVSAQNLVPNPSFEEKDSCPTIPWNNIQDVAIWNNPSYGYPKYFHSCDTTNSASVPINLFGNQLAIDGYAYIALDTYKDGGWGTHEVRDYAQVKLTKPLKANKKYYWCFWVSLCDTSAFATNNIGISLSDTLVNQPTSQSLNLPVYDNHSQVISNKNDWVKLSGNFIAIGGEEYLIIGNFYTQPLTIKIIATTSLLVVVMVRTEVLTI
jgi:hypothetical protein